MIIQCDFDGTVTTNNLSLLLRERFAIYHLCPRTGSPCHHAKSDAGSKYKNAVGQG